MDEWEYTLLSLVPTSRKYCTCEHRKREYKIREFYWLKSEVLTHETFDRTLREHRVISEHSLRSLLLDTTHCSGFLLQNLVQVFHDLQLLSPLIFLLSEVSSTLRSAFCWWGFGRSAWGLWSVLIFTAPAFNDHPLGLAKNEV